MPGGPCCLASVCSTLPCLPASLPRLTHSLLLPPQPAPHTHALPPACLLPPCRGPAGTSCSTWTGVRVSDLLRLCGVKGMEEGAQFVCFRGPKGKHLQLQ